MRWGGEGVGLGRGWGERRPCYPCTLWPAGRAVNARVMICHAAGVERHTHATTTWPAALLRVGHTILPTPLTPATGLRPCADAQVQLVRLRALSSLRQGDAEQRARHAQHAQGAELHVEFEAAVRWRQQHAASSGHLYGGEPGDAAAAGSSQQQHLHQAAAAGGAGAAAAAAADGSTSQGPEMDPEEYCRRSRRFVNDDRVRDRVSSQLAGLRRRASMRQEFE